MRRLLALGAIALAGAALAAEPPDPGAQLGLERQQRERQRQEEQLERRPAPAPLGTPAAPAALPPASRLRNIPVQRIETGPSEVLGADELRALVAPYEGRTLSLADLVELTEAINALYAAKGAPTARALLPPQEIEQGRVRIQLVEARLGRIALGPTRLGQALVREHLGLVSGELVSVPRIEAALQRFNRSHEVQLAATLAAGASPGTSDLALQASDPPFSQWTLFADNAGSTSLGERRLGLALRLPLLSERGDSLNASLLLTGRAPSPSLSLGYALPLAPLRRLDLSYSQGRIAVRRGSFAALDLTGRSRDLGLGLTQTLLLKPEGSWSAGLRLSAKDSATDVAGERVRQQQLTVLGLSSTLDWQDEAGSWSGEAQLARGLRAAGGEASYTVLRASLARLLRLANGQQWLLRAALQLSPDPDLPSSEQFQLGGSASVRGYAEGLLSARRGAFASLEWRRPLALGDLTRCATHCALQLLAHADVGSSRPGGGHGAQTLASVGLGLAGERGPVSVRLGLAWPLRQPPAEAAEAPTRRPRLHLSASTVW